MHAFCHFRERQFELGRLSEFFNQAPPFLVFRGLPSRDELTALHKETDPAIRQRIPSILVMRMFKVPHNSDILTC